MEYIFKQFFKIIIIFVVVILYFSNTNLITMAQPAWPPPSSPAIGPSVADYCKNNPDSGSIICGLQLLFGGEVDWPFNIDGLILGDQNSIFDYIMGLLGMGIIFASILGIVFGLRIIFFQWIYYADQYNEDKLKEIKKKAWYIALGWGALVIGFVIVSMLNNQFGTNLL